MDDGERKFHSSAYNKPPPASSSFSSLSSVSCKSSHHNHPGSGSSSQQSLRKISGRSKTKSNRQRSSSSSFFSMPKLQRVHMCQSRQEEMDDKENENFFPVFSNEDGGDEREKEESSRSRSSSDEWSPPQPTDLYYTANANPYHLTHEERIQGLHHRSRIKAIPCGGEGATGSRRKQEEGGEPRTGKRRRISSTYPSSSSSFPSGSSSIDDDPCSRPPSSSSASLSPSRFLLTFLSSCRLVQVTSRLVVALAMTSLFLILVNVMPGAYCSSSTMSVYSSSTSVRTTSSTGAAATKRAYYNQSLLPHHHLKMLEAFQPTSSFPSGGGGYQQQTWLKTRWPLTLKVKQQQNSNNHNEGGGGGVEDGEGAGLGVVANLNNKLYSNQLGVTSLTKHNSDDNDYLNNPNHHHLEEEQQQNNINTIGSPARTNVVAGSTVLNGEIKSAKLDNNKIATNNYDYYNNGNNNNNANYNDNTANTNLSNRSNYNYNYDSFVEGSQQQLSQSQSNQNQNQSSTKEQLLLRSGNKSVNSKASSDNDDENTQKQPRRNSPPPSGSGYEQLASNNPTPEEEDDFLDTEIIETTGAGMIITQPIHDNEQPQQQHQLRASTAKDGITSANMGVGQLRNNGTTKAERDNVANVSSTGVRPTMAFTHSYFGRSPPQQSIVEDGTRGRARSNRNNNDGDFGGDDAYGGGNHEYNGDIMQADQSEPSLLPVAEDNNGRDLRGGGSEGVYYRIERRTKSWRKDDNSNHKEDGDGDVGVSGTIPFSPSASASASSSSFSTLSAVSSPSSSSHLQFRPNKHHVSSSSNPTAITRTTTTISEKHNFKTSKLGISATAAGGGDRITFPSQSTSFYSIPTSAQAKSINSPGSTATLHYPDENVLEVVSSSSASGLSKPHHHSHNNGHSSSGQQHHNHHYHQHEHEHERQKEEEFSGNEVLTFGGPPDDYEEEFVVDEEEMGENDDDDVVGEVIRKTKSQQQQQQHPNKNKIESNFIDNSPPPPSPPQSVGLKKSTNYFKHQQQQRSASSRHNIPSGNRLEENDNGHIDDEELIIKNGRLEPTASVAASTSTKSNPKKYSSHEEETMAGDDPSVISSGMGSSSSQPKLMSIGDDDDGASTTATTFGKPRSPLQIRRDLSRLIATGAGGVRALNSVANGGGLVGVDEEPMPNKCDRLFMSSGSTGGPVNGTFESPTMISEEGHLYQCIFMFVAKPSERVEVVFTQFNVRGTPPECVHEWVDIWTEVEGTDPTDLVNTPFSGRYCGRIPPRRRISLYGGIAIGFYSDKNSTDESIFRGNFAFINDTPYQIGTPVPRTLCSYVIQGASKRNGDLISPTYPGVYPKNLSCSYKFVGIEGQRIRPEFRDFDVFYGGAHCPFDEVKVYDGMDPTTGTPLIGTYCGQQRNLVVFSSAHLMLVTFTTLDRSTEAQNRGFKGVWEFSESFVKLDFIEKNMGTHIRGTECDQRILSKGQSAGVVYSPNYPFPYVPKIVCRYFIYGLQDPQHLERVRLSFEKFDVITSINSEEDTTNQSDVKKCGDGFLKVYLKGQEVIQAYDKADYEFCGKEVPHDVVSDGPRLVLVFSSGEPVGSGFKARYQFETEYRVPGTAAPDGSCHFTYYSSSRMKGEFNSPRFPSNYPSTTNCTYIFFQQPNEQVRIVFDNFKMKSDKFNYTDRGAYGDLCEEDWVEVWNVISDADDRLVGRYCGSTAPGPIESREKASALKVILHTDEEGVSSGFKARYIYFTAKTIFGECGQNITQSQSGVLTSPKWPGKYDGPQKGEGSATCNWYLSVRPGSRVMLHFQNFAIEGEPNGRGCPAAAVRIWIDPDGVPVELCGESLMVENSQYVSARNLMRVTFITADKAVGAPGFRAVWTEVQEVPRTSGGSPCHHSYFRCEKSLFCIPADLRCDGVNNCGTNEGDNDYSDEELCGLEFGDMNTIIAIVVGVALSLFFIVLLCAWGQRRKRRRRRRLQLRRPPIHVCDNAGARFVQHDMDSV